MKRTLTFWQMAGRTLAVLILGVVLLAILFPACGCKNREKARQTLCLSIEKQLGLSLFQYAEDNDGLLPVAATGHSTWRGAIYPLTKEKSVYKCPDDTCGIAPDGFPSSYALNVGSVQDTPGAKPQILQFALYPEPLVLLCEVQNTTDPNFDIEATTPSLHILAVRHSGGSNYLLADGHAKWLKPLAFTDTRSDAGGYGHAVVRWHRDPLHPISENEIAMLADAQARAQ